MKKVELKSQYTKDENEYLGADGESATQEPQTYTIYHGDMKVNLIDTPGIGDVRGIDRDNENFVRIINHLDHYEKIDAICVVMKPSNSRLTVLFKFCFHQLLAHLHSSAKNNIVFCFTNTRGTLYRPGDTLPTLTKDLRRLNCGLGATQFNMF